MNHEPETRARPPEFGWLLTWLAAYVVLGGLVSLLGWAADIRRLTDWDDTGISIQPNTTVAAMAAGIAVLLLARGSRGPAAVLGALVLLIGLSVIFQRVSGTDLGVDTPLMFGRMWGREGVVSPGRMGPPGSVAWTLIGFGILLASLPRRSKARRAVPLLATITASISGLGLIGYLYGVSPLYALPTLTVIALQTASFILAVSICLLLSVPEYGPVRLLTADSPGGLLARRIMPVGILVPLLFGLVRLTGERAGYYDTAFGTAIRTVFEILVFLLFLWFTSTAIDRQAWHREKADRASRANQKRVVDTLENITNAFVTLDREWRFTHVNAEAERQLGKSRQELLGRSCWELFPETVGGIADRELHRAAAEHTTVTFEEYDRVRKKWFASKASPTADSELAIHFEDITPRKTAEAALELSRHQLEAELSDTRLLQGLSTELIAEENSQQLYERILDTAVGIMRSQFASIQIFRPERGERGELLLLAHRGLLPEVAEAWTWVGIDSESICGEAMRAGHRVIASDLESTDSHVGNRELAQYRRLGARAVQSTPLFSRSGNLLGMISNHWREPHEPDERALRLLDILARQAADLLDRKNVERQREELLHKEQAARSDAERAGRLKDEFLATLSHELRTPLNAVVGWSQILKKDIANPEKARVAIDIIERNARLQAQLITDILDISRITCGNMRLDVQRVELPAIIQAAIDSILPTAEAKGVLVQSHIEPIEEPINGDASRLQQVVWNLLSNAVKFTPRGGRVDVELAGASSHAEIRVSDTGEGITAEFLPHIFERFRQADASASRSHGGLGLGLAIVKQFVELHGGGVRAASEGPGRGATFVIELPLASVGEKERDVLVPQPRAASVGFPRVAPVSLRGLRVLVVDDQADALAMLRRILEDHEAEPGLAPSSQVALDLLAQREFDLIVSDIGMAGRDGYEFISIVRARGIRTPALALTAFAREEDRAKAMLSGYQAHLTKPVEADALLAAMASLAGRGGLTQSSPPA